jgi:hypothetical protein
MGNARKAAAVELRRIFSPLMIFGIGSEQVQSWA